MTKTKQELIEFIETTTGIRNVLEDAKFEDLGFDSLDGIELAMALEEEFEIEIPDEVASKLLSVTDVIEYLKTKNINLL